jgi:hypothetical protein
MSVPLTTTIRVIHPHYGESDLILHSEDTGGNDRSCIRLLDSFHHPVVNMMEGSVQYSMFPTSNAEQFTYLGKDRLSSAVMMQIMRREEEPTLGTIKHLQAELSSQHPLILDNIPYVLRMEFYTLLTGCMTLIPIKAKTVLNPIGERQHMVKELVESVYQRKPFVPSALKSNESRVRLYEPRPTPSRDKMMNGVLEIFRADCSAGFVGYRSLILLVWLLCHQPHIPPPQTPHTLLSTMTVDLHQSDLLWSFYSHPSHWTIEYYRSLVSDPDRSSDVHRALLFRQSALNVGRAVILGMVEKPNTCVISVLSMHRTCTIRVDMTTHQPTVPYSSEELDLVIDTTGLESHQFLHIVKGWTNEVGFVGLHIVHPSVEVCHRTAVHVLSTAYAHELPCTIAVRPRPRHGNEVTSSVIHTGLRGLKSQLSVYKERLDGSIILGKWKDASQLSLLHTLLDTSNRDGIALPIESMNVPMSSIPKNGYLLAYSHEQLMKRSCSMMEASMVWKEMFHALTLTASE